MPPRFLLASVPSVCARGAIDLGGVGLDALSQIHTHTHTHTHTQEGAEEEIVYLVAPGSLALSKVDLLGETHTHTHTQIHTSFFFPHVSTEDWPSFGSLCVNVSVCVCVREVKKALSLVVYRMERRREEKEEEEEEREGEERGEL